MTLYKLIDRSTGDVLRTRRETSMERVLNKPKVWLATTRNDPGVYDPDTHKAVSRVDRPDLSDLNVDVSPSAVRVEDWDIVALTAQELQSRKLRNILETDEQLPRMIEDILVQIASGQPLTRDSFPSQLWTKINRRRTLRGLPEV